MSLIKETHPTYNIYQATASLQPDEWQCLDEAIARGNNIILDLSHLKEPDNALFPAFRKLARDISAQEMTLVIVARDPALMSHIRKEALNQLLNICPTVQEAIDIISMDMLERDLLKEE